MTDKKEAADEEQPQPQDPNLVPDKGRPISAQTQLGVAKRDLPPEQRDDDE